jgi:hypothetical protein
LKLFPYRQLLRSNYEPSGNYMYRQFNIQQFYVLPYTDCIYVFCVDLRTNSDFFSSMQQQLMGFYNRSRECFLRGKNWVFKLDSYNFVLKGLRQRRCRSSHLSDNTKPGNNICHVNQNVSLTHSFSHSLNYSLTQ